MSAVPAVSRPFRHRTVVRMVGLAAVLAVALTLGTGPPSSAGAAGDKDRLDADIARLRTSLEDTSKNLANAFVKLRRTRLERPRVRAALVAADAAQVAADRHNDEVASALGVAQANEAKATETLARNARAIEDVRDQLGNLVRDDYQQGGVSGLSIALDANSPDDLTSRMILRDTVMRVRRTALRSLDTMRVQAKAGRSHLVAVRQQVVALKVQAENALTEATVARQAKAAAKARLDLLYAAQSRYAATVVARKAQESTNLERMQGESRSLTRALAARARAVREAAARAADHPVPHGSPRDSSPQSSSPRGGSSEGDAPRGGRGGFLRYPSDAPVSSEFGMRFHPIWRTSLMHAGIDFAASCGSPVYAAADGDVVMATPESASGGYGNRLVIDHGLHRGVDLTTTYNHLTRFVVTAGHVARGQLVAYSGTTGTSTGCHLHFETRQDGTPVNPRGWL